MSWVAALFPSNVSLSLQLIIAESSAKERPLLVWDKIMPVNYIISEPEAGPGALVSVVSLNQTSVTEI